MGLSIYYRGRIKDRALLPQLIESVSDVCRELGWEYRLFNKHGIEGLYFAPEGSEPLSLTFDKEGCLTDFRHILLGLESDETVNGVIVKTQYAGADAHRAVIDLFRWIERAYLADFEMSDESQYWETGDETVLRENFERYDLLLNAVARALDTFPAQDGEPAEQMAERLGRFLRERFGGAVQTVRISGES